jgi:hypothetical protein
MSNKEELRKSKAFVLMPFDTEFTAIYEQLIKPSLEVVGYEVARADSFLHQQNILRDIVKGIATADLIIAEVTTPNPNVFYELGICHGLRKPTVLLTQSIDEVPFDLRGYRVQVYSTQFHEIDILKDALRKIGESHRRQEIEFGSPVIDFLSADDIPGQSTLIVEAEEDTKPMEMEQGRRGLVEAAQAMKDLLAIVSKLVPDVNKSISRVNDQVERFGQASNAAQQRKSALLIASGLNNGAKYVEETIPNLDQTIDISTEFITGYVLRRNREDREELIHFREQVSTILGNVTAAVQVMRTRADGVLRLGDISAEVDAGSKRMSKALRGIVSSFEKLEGVCKRTIQIIDDKLGESNGG